MEIGARRERRAETDLSRWTLKVTTGALGFLAVLVVVLLVSPAMAALDRFSAGDFREEDNQAAEVLAGYPAEARRAALVVAGYPEELLAIQKIQQRSSDDFAALLTDFSRAEQEQVWNLVRHPDLAGELASGGRKSVSELEDIAARYPEEDRAAIVEEGREHYPTWVRIHALDLEVESVFTRLISNQPTSVQNAFNEVANRPDLMTLLIDHMHMTTVLGAVYRDDPSRVEAQFAQLHEEVAARNREKERAWAEEVADPEAAEELEYAAREFAEAYDYDVEEVAQTTSSPRTVHVHHHVNVRPYPFWFSYPTWYDYAYWYPRPFRSHVGFSFGHGYGHRHGGGFVSFGLPSPFFLSWYHDFYRPRHLTRRAGYRGIHRLARRSVRYYDNHRPLRSAKRYRGNRGRFDGRGPAWSGQGRRAGFAEVDFRRPSRRVSSATQRLRRDSIRRDRSSRVDRRLGGNSRGEERRVRGATRGDRHIDWLSRGQGRQPPSKDRSVRRERQERRASGERPERRDRIQRRERSIHNVSGRQAGAERRVKRSPDSRRADPRRIRVDRSERSDRSARGVSQRGNRSTNPRLGKMERRERRASARQSVGRSSSRPHVGAGRGQSGQRKARMNSGGGNRERRGGGGGGGRRGGNRGGGRNRN